MPFEIKIRRSAEKEMDRLPGDVLGRVVTAILKLESDPRHRGCKKLRGSDAYRIRVGNYRILYLIDDAQQVVDVMAVGHRRDIYAG